MDLVTMSKEGIHRLEVMPLQEKRISQRTAAKELEVSVRQVKRLLQEYRQEGARGAGIKTARAAGPSSDGTGNREASHRSVDGTLPWD